MTQVTRTDQQRRRPKSVRARSEIGTIVKALRTKADVTLTELADRSGLAISTVSKIESGQLLPGYETIQRLAVGLEIDVADLFRERLSPLSSGRRGVTRKGEGARLSSPHYEYEALAGDLSRKQFLPLMATIKARSVDEFRQLPAHEGEEFVFVISGTVELHSEHYEPLTLKPGDSVYFDSRAGHALVSTGEEDARIVWICSDRDVLRKPRIESDDQN
jgi:transcriptional regulator with XRE-family HTH domain